MKTLPIVWQRLVIAGGKTCPRCEATHGEILRAVGQLTEVLRPLGIEPTLEIKEIDEDTFMTSPSESNRIWIADRPMEEWLDAKVGSSRCSSVCGEYECRTVEVGTMRFETIPHKLLLKAALIAASSILDFS